jgi:hypothetical protein
MPTAKKKRKPAAGKTGKTSADFQAVFASLKKILKPYEKQFRVVPYRPEFYGLQTRRSGPKGKPVWFAGVRMEKNYVSYHLVPIYMNPALKRRVSPELRKRMQGKACFNFAEINSALFRELRALTAAGADCYRKRKFL